MARTERRPQAFRPAEDLAELMGLADEDFIYCAFWSMLGRGADPDGFSYYVARLRRGVSKVSILNQMAKSEEFEELEAPLPGLRKLLWRYRLSRIPVLGLVFRRLFKIGGDSPTMQLLRSIDNRVQALDYAMDQILPKLDALAAQANDREHGSRHVQKGRSRSGQASNSATRDLTLRARRTYEQLLGKVGNLSL